MFAQARAELPNECCGLLAGVVESGSASANSEPIGRVVRRYPLINAAASPVEFLSADKSMLAAHNDMRLRNIDILAVYHSHPASDPLPSKKDLELNYSTQVVTLIISLKSGNPVMLGWWLSENSAVEAEWGEVSP
jgi:[CysO sulfur-carrier protein]-S-L-cysteine hydrolase